MTRRTRDRRVKRHTAITSPREIELAMQPIPQSPTSNSDAVEPLPKSLIISHIDKLKADQEEIIRFLEQLDDRIKALEEGNATAAKPDSLQTEILKFFKQHAPMKFNTGTVAGNLGKESGKVSHRIRILARKGLLNESKEEGYSTLFWWEDDKKEKASE